MHISTLTDEIVAYMLLIEIDTLCVEPNDYRHLFSNSTKNEARVKL